MSTFGRVKKYTKPSKALDEKAKFLEKELKKTGVVVEAAPANSTANLYTVVRMGNSSKEWIDDSSYNGKALTWGSTTKDLTRCWSPDNLRYATQFEGYGLWGPVPYAERNDVMWYWDSSAGRYYNLQWGNVFDGSSWSITWGAWESTAYGARLSSENLPSSLVAALTNDGNVVSPADLRAPDEPILVARHSLDDADYYPGNPTSFLASLLGTAEKGVEYLKDKAGDTQIAGGHYGTGHSKHIDIDGRGWSVSPDQLQKMKANPERFNLSPSQIRMIKKAEKSKEKQTVSAHYEPQGKVILERKKDPYIKITTKEPFPRIIITRQKRSDGAAYFGPYPSIGSSRSLRRLPRGRRAGRGRDRRRADLGWCAELRRGVRPSRPLVSLGINRVDGWRLLL